MTHLKLNEFVHNLDFEQYQKEPGLNQSELKKWLRPFPMSSKGYSNVQALEFGTAGHCMLLEPEKFEHEYSKAPEHLKQRGKSGKKRWSEFCQQHPDQNFLRSNDWDRLMNIRKICKVHPQIQQLMQKGESEISLFWEDADEKIPCKARLDWLCKKTGNIVDLKFTQNINTHKIQKSIQEHLALQASWYTRGVGILTGKKPNFSFIFIEKYMPHKIIIHQVTDEEFVVGAEKIKLALHNLKSSQNP